MSTQKKKKRRFGVGSMIATVFVLLAVGTGVNLYSTFKPKQSTIVTAKDAEAEMRTIPHDYKIHLLTENFPPFNMAMTKNTQQPPTEVGGLVTYGLKVRIRVD